MLRTLIAIVYLGVGVLVAATNDYLVIDNLKDVLSAGLAILLWPLVLADVNLHFETLSKDGDKKGGLVGLAGWRYGRPRT